MVIGFKLLNREYFIFLPQLKEKLSQENYTLNLKNNLWISLANKKSDVCGSAKLVNIMLSSRKVFP